MTRAFPFMALLLLPLLVVACDSDASTARPEQTGPFAKELAALPAVSTLPRADAVDGSATIFAASSLTETFEDLRAAFVDKYPGVDLRFNFAASSALALQLQEGASAGVFASADSEQMDALLASGRATRSWLFASNELALIVPKGSAAVRTFEDLANPGVRLVLAGEQVPAGRYAREMLRKASAPGAIAPDFADNVLSNLRSNESNVRAVLTKVQLGEAGAGIVYTTDLEAAAGEVEQIPLPDEYNVRTTYPVALIDQGSASPAAAAFVLFLFSEEGQAMLRNHGFGAAP